MGRFLPRRNLVMMDWIAGAYGGIKAATDITQSMLTLKTDAAVTTKVVELNGVLLGLQSQLNSAHADQTTLTRRIGELEAEIAQFKRWEQEKERYQLHQTEAGGLVYRIKPEVQGTEPLHYICADCYQKGIKTILQPCFDGCYKALRCHPCKSVVHAEKIPDSGLTHVSQYDPFSG
ncbi:TPA: hypothetical protein RQ837_006418 [Pseudomonas aeruginosa]|uniref:Uncharacterized protein ORF25 n=2 Tax=root TaxID=1 RepID=B7SDZ0_9CAUD|nr:hypothetical protein PPMP38_gp27 [Pseudomonas phage MP38]EJA3276793.1 hypothetical protein [Pseudomonas aeruginosa]ACA57723.1 hypothetical protein [Pseudomonas phage MP38]EJC0103439.1 hypothetical protein [Pseudomonas aeruginosa]EJN8991446.1 hypothetical protein [Pseudomonas aeruginosa]EJN9535571.1 hypothetical protein [Pseudomonas aeruginosa]